MQEIRRLHREADYDWALGEIEAYFEREPEPGTREADRLDRLAAFIEDYEALARRAGGEPIGLWPRRGAVAISRRTVRGAAGAGA